MPLFGENVLQSGLFVFALIWTVAFLLLRSMQYSRRNRAKSTASPAKSARPTAAELSPPDSVRKWEVHLHEVARDLSGQIDTKLGLLQQLLTMVEEERTRLEAVVAEAQAIGRRTADAGTEAKAGSRSAAPPSTTARRQPIDRRQEIYQLADEGLEPAAIARQLGQPAAEVELILSLRSSRRAV